MLYMSAPTQMCTLYVSPQTQLLPIVTLCTNVSTDIGADYRERDNDTVTITTLLHEGMRPTCSPPNFWRPVAGTQLSTTHLSATTLSSIHVHGLNLCRLCTRT